MKFLISMADVEDEWDSLPQAERDRIDACDEAFIRDLGDRYLGCWGARPSCEARTVRRSADGKFSVSSGTMTPTKEPLGGFYIIGTSSQEHPTLLKVSTERGSGHVRRVRIR